MTGPMLTPFPGFLASRGPEMRHRLAIEARSSRRRCEPYKIVGKGKRYSQSSSQTLPLHLLSGTLGVRTTSSGPRPVVTIELLLRLPPTRHRYSRIVMAALSLLLCCGTCRGVGRWILRLVRCGREQGCGLFGNGVLVRRIVRDVDNDGL